MSALELATWLTQAFAFAYCLHFSQNMLWVFRGKAVRKVGKDIRESRCQNDELLVKVADTSLSPIYVIEFALRLDLVPQEGGVSTEPADYAGFLRARRDAYLPLWWE